jgi:hypothetical protein
VCHHHYSYFHQIANTINTSPVHKTDGQNKCQTKRLFTGCPAVRRVYWNRPNGSLAVSLACRDERPAFLTVWNKWLTWCKPLTCNIQQSGRRSTCAATHTRTHTRTHARTRTPRPSYSSLTLAHTGPLIHLTTDSESLAHARAHTDLHTQPITVRFKAYGMLVLFWNQYLLWVWLTGPQESYCANCKIRVVDWLDHRNDTAVTAKYE